MSGVVLSLALVAGCGDDDGAGEDPPAGAADPSLDQRQLVIDHLAGVSQAYESGDAAGAEEHFGEAEEAWGEASSAFTDPEATAIQGQLDALAGQLESSAPAESVVDAVESLNTDLAAGPEAPAG